MLTDGVLGKSQPDISFVMPCYNEEAIVGYTVKKLFSAFEKAGFWLELVAVDNGSRDRTGQILGRLAEEHRTIISHRIAVNQGYGNGILAGIPLCTAPWVGFIPADGQVDAEDAVRLYEAAVAANQPVLAKVRRLFRMDGVRRKIVSTAYNLFFRLLWPALASLDINGTPKILPRDILGVMQLASKDWFLDAEIMIKAHALRIRVIEFNVFARMRGGGRSHVHATTCWEFFRNLLSYRFASEWKRELLERRAGMQPCVTNYESVVRS